MSTIKGNKGNKGSKGTKGSHVPRYGTDLAGKTPRQPTSVIPESETAKQMVENTQRDSYAKFTPDYKVDVAIDRAIDEGTPEAFIQLKDISDSQFQEWKNRHPESKIDADWLKTVRDNPYRLAVSQLSPYDITLPPLPLWEFPKKLKEQPVEIQQQFFDRLNEEQVARIPYQWGDYWRDKHSRVDELLPELVVQQRRLTRYQDPYNLHDVYPYGFNRHRSTLNESLDSNALTNQEGYIHTRPVYNQNTGIPYYPNHIPKSKKNKSNISNSPEKSYVRDALHNNEIRPDLPTFNPKLIDAGLGVGALTGLGLTAYPFLSVEDENEVPAENAYTETPQTQAEPTLEQQYASQPIPETDSGIWGEKINKLTHPTLKDFLPNSSIVPLSPLNREVFHQPLAVSSNINDLVRNGYKGTPDVPSELPANTSQDTFIAPRELPAKGQTLADYNKNNPPQDVTSGPRVLNAPVEKKAVTTKPVQPDDRLTEANLASAMAREAVSPQVLQYGSPAYLQENKPVDMRQWVRQKYGMSMSPAEMVQRGIMPYEYLQYW